MEAAPVAVDAPSNGPPMGLIVGGVVAVIVIIVLVMMLTLIHI
jgi:hypothetical protein